MADEVEKFVLQYDVSIKDSVDRLEQLLNKSEQLQNAPRKVKNEFADFTRDATNEIGRLIPGVDKLSAAIRGMGAGFGVAAAGVATLAAGITAVIKMREQYNTQRVQGLEMGVSGMRLEEYQRKFARNSDGRVSRELAASEIGKFSQKLQSAYQDPTRMSPENRQMQMLGVQVAPRGQRSLPLNTSLTQLGTSLSKMNEADVRGVAKAIGMNQDFAVALAKMGPQIGKVTEFTNAEIAARNKAEKELTKFNSELLNLGQSFTTMSNKLGEHLIPAFTALITKINSLIDLANKFMPGTEDKTTQVVKHNASNIYDNLTFPGMFNKISEGDLPGVPGMLINYAKAKLGSKEQTGPTADKPVKMEPTPLAVGVKAGSFGTTVQDMIDRVKSSIGISHPSDVTVPAIPNAPRPKDAAAPAGKNDQGTEQARVDALINQLDETSSEGVQTANQMALAINMFNGAVHTFASVIDERQAWAAWAGEIGRANRLRGMDNVQRAGGSYGYDEGRAQAGTYHPSREVRAKVAHVEAPPEVTPYDAHFEKYGRENGIDPDLLKAVAMQESRMNPNAKSGVGAEGLMQVMPMNKKTTGVTDLLDPEQNIKAGARVLGDFLKRAKGDIELALRYYHGGTDKSKWGPVNDKYAPETLARYSQLLQRRPNAMDNVRTHNVVGADGYERIEVTPDWKVAREQKGTIDPQSVRGRSSTSGESRGTIQANNAQKEIAGRLGIEARQMRSGEVNRGDAEWSARQIQAGIENKIFEIKKELMAANLPEQTRAALMEDLKSQQTGLAQMQAFSPSIVQGAQEGERSITIGEKAITINVEGVQDPNTVANMTSEKLREQLGDLINNAANAIRY